MTDTRVATVMRYTGTSLPEAINLLNESAWSVSKAVRSHSGKTQVVQDVSFSSMLCVEKTSKPMSATSHFTVLKDKHDHVGNEAPTVSCESKNEGAKEISSIAQPVTRARMQRGLSKAGSNFPILFLAREMVLKDLAPAGSEEKSEYFIETPIYTFVLPDINLYREDFKAFLHKDLIDASVLVTLEQEGYLNWWVNLGIGPRLYPMVTTGDGNCLLHAASLAMWGFHDRKLVIRKLLNNMTTGKSAAAFQRRWRWQQTRTNKQCGLVLTDGEWKDEWKNLVSLASVRPRSNTTEPIASSDAEEEDDDISTVYGSLEEIHVFILAHVLRRPIMVVCQNVLKDVYGMALAPVPFGGIYLPLECHPADCYKSPLLLTYHLGHFSGLVCMEGHDTPATLPLVNQGLELLPIHFTYDPGPNHIWSSGSTNDDGMSLVQCLDLVGQYMDLEQVALSKNAESDFGIRPRTSTWSGIQLMSDCSGKSKLHEKSHKHLPKSLSHTFGSLGRNFSKKLTNKKDGSTTQEEPQQLTQSTRKQSVTVEMLMDHSKVLCARFVQRHMFYQDDFIRNYLEFARPIY